MVFCDNKGGIKQAGFPFKAVIVGTDLNAVGIVVRLTELGYRVPEDFL
jgi:DNA-binding LacI/PurR family transcriptional regulator